MSQIAYTRRNSFRNDSGQYLRSNRVLISCIYKLYFKCVTCVTCARSIYDIAKDSEIRKINIKIHTLMPLLWTFTLQLLINIKGINLCKRHHAHQYLENVDPKMLELGQSYSVDRTDLIKCNKLPNNDSLPKFCCQSYFPRPNRYNWTRQDAHFRPCSP